jgi:hypothetical protein
MQDGREQASDEVRFRVTCTLAHASRDNASSFADAPWVMSRVQRWSSIHPFTMAIK